MTCGKGSVSVLHIVNKWGQGGVERFVEGLVAGLPSDRFEQSILSVCTPVRSAVFCSKYGPLFQGEGMLPMLAGARRLKGFLSGCGYDVVHVHTNNSSGFLYAAVARSCGVGARLVHSHNSGLGAGSGPLKCAAQLLVRSVFAGAETGRLACSTQAGRHLFGKREFRVVPNGVDTARFSFDPAARREVRASLGVGEETFVVGCVGSFIPAKNHLRALSVFNGLHRERPDSLLVLLGDGLLREELEARVAALGIEDATRMPGFVADAAPWYSAMDALLFPSLYEGLPIALVEAQCNGLPVVASDAVTDEVRILDSYTSVSLSATDSEWVRALLSCQRISPSISCKCVREFGYGVDTTMKMMSEIYGGTTCQG